MSLSSKSMLNVIRTFRRGNRPFYGYFPAFTCLRTHWLKNNKLFTWCCCCSSRRCAAPPRRTRRMRSPRTPQSTPNPCWRRTETQSGERRSEAHARARAGRALQRNQKQEKSGKSQKLFRDAAKRGSEPNEGLRAADAAFVWSTEPRPLRHSTACDQSEGCPRKAHFPGEVRLVKRPEPDGMMIDSRRFRSGTQGCDVTTWKIKFTTNTWKRDSVLILEKNLFFYKLNIRNKGKIWSFFLF